MFASNAIRKAAPRRATLRRWSTTATMAAGLTALGMLTGTGISPAMADLKLCNTPCIGAVSEDEYREMIETVYNFLIYLLLVIAILSALVGSIGLAGTMSMNVLERTREIGVLRAIGAHNQIVSKLVIIESILIGLISFCLGSVLSLPITSLLSNVISLSIFNSPAEFIVTARGFGIWFGLVLLLSTGASLLPAHNATKLTIREVLAYE